MNDVELSIAGHGHNPSKTQSSNQKYPDDDAYLQSLGKRSLLTRAFGFMSILGLSCSALLSWEGILATSISGLLNGGPAGVVRGFLINWIGTISVYTSLGELVSMAPTSGGQYHWVAMMAPPSWSSFLAYVTGWLTTLAWQALAVSVSYIVATLLQGIIALSRPTYVPLPRALAKCESFILILHLAGFFGVLIPLVYFAPHSSPSEVFTTFFNEGGWSSQGLSFLVGFPAIAGSLLGADCAVHMSEEIQSAAIVVPRALLYTILINGLLAFAMIIALMFCLGDVAAAVESAETSLFYPFLEIFYQAAKSTTGAGLLAGIVLVLAIASSIGVYASASCMLWSFSRDLGLPFSKHLVKLNKTSLPVVSISTTLVVTVLLSLIVLGSVIVLNALLSLAIAALFSSYTLPFGTINNIFSIVYNVFLLFWSFWPRQTPTTPEGFNWSVVVFVGVVIFSVLWYVTRANSYFKGPVKGV
ncbi:amino acid transporter [Xylaria digitata]|nr:amino acid transporter [Xylaria digitata]